MVPCGYDYDNRCTNLHRPLILLLVCRRTNATMTNTTNCSIKGATSAAYVPVAADVGNNGVTDTLTAVATYTDGNGDGKDYAAVRYRRTTSDA